MRFSVSILQLLFLISGVLLAPFSANVWAQNLETDPMTVEAKLSAFEWNPGQGGSLELKIHLPSNYHAYEDKFNVVILEPDGFKLSTPLVEPIHEWFDKFSKKERRGVKDDATIKMHIEAPDRFLKNYQNMKIEMTYQACSDQFCLFPTTKLIQVPIHLNMIEGEAELTTSDAATSTAKPSGMSLDSLSHHISGSLAFALLVAFLAGVLTSFTPCIFPMIPITLAVLGNKSEERTRMQNFITSCVYVLGIATTYSILGLVAASSGALFGASLGNPYVLSVICVIFLAMALSMYGLYEVQVPAVIRDRFGRSKSQGGMLNAYLTGLFAGIVASPCVGPVLVAILTHVASTKDHLRGFLLLFCYAVGMGLIFIALGLSNQLLKLLPRSGAWMNGTKFILGSLMLSAFYYYLSMLLPARWFDLALGVGLVIVASVYGAFLSVTGLSILNRVRKGLMQAMLILGIGYLILSAFDLRPYINSQFMAGNSLNQIQKLNWQMYSEEALAKAAQERKPVIIDFWAEWCAACHELEEKTFTDPRVRAMAENYVLLKFDATTENEQLKILKKKYSIQGLPTVVFINPNGVWIDALTLTQFEKAEAFLKRMEKGAN